MALPVGFRYADEENTLPDGFKYEDDVSVDAEKPKARPSGVDGLLSNILTGSKQTGRMVGAAGNAYTGDLKDVEVYADASRKSSELDTPLEQSKLQGELAQIDRNQGALGQIGDVLSAAGRNKMGTAQMVVEQAPNSVVALGSGAAGAKVGAMAGGAIGSVVPIVGTAAGAAVGGTLGFLGGMFLGNTLLETGGKALEKAEGGFTEEERGEAIKEGVVKGGVITAVDAATFGIGGKVASTLGRAAQKAGARAEAKVLADAGVDMTSPATINAALAADGKLFTAAKNAGEQAAKFAISRGRKAAIAGTGLTMETAGEGAGEYLGELAATGKGDVVDATIEALTSFSQSAIETGYNYNKSIGNNLSAKGIHGEAGLGNQASVEVQGGAADQAVAAADTQPSPEPEKAAGVQAPSVMQELANTGDGFRQFSDRADWMEFAGQEGADIEQRRADLLQQQGDARQQMRLDSDIETTDARVLGAQQAQTRADRLALLDEVYANEKERTPGLTFLGRLEELYPNNPDPTPEEKALIAKRHTSYEAFKGMPAPEEETLAVEGALGQVERPMDVQRQQVDEYLANGFRPVAGGTALMNARGKRLILNAGQREYLKTVRRQAPVPAVPVQPEISKVPNAILTNSVMSAIAKSGIHGVQAQQMPQGTLERAASRGVAQPMMPPALGIGAGITGESNVSNIAAPENTGVRAGGLSAAADGGASAGVLGNDAGRVPGYSARAGAVDMGQGGAAQPSANAGKNRSQDNSLSNQTTGYDTPIEVDAKAFQAAFERENGEPLAWNKMKADAIRAGTGKASSGLPEVALGGVRGDRLGVNDGRHRIAVAAERGEKIKVLASAEDAKRIAEKLNTTPATQTARAPAPVTTPQSGPDLPTMIRPHIEAMVKLRADAKQSGMQIHFNDALAKAKKAQGGELSDPKVLRQAAKKFDGKVAGVASALNAVADAIDPAKQVRQAPVTQAKPVTASQNLVQRIKQLGGVNISYIRDITGEAKANKVGAVGLFTQNGLGLDDLATQLEAEGFDLNTADESDNGGVNQLRDLIREAVDGNPVVTRQERERMLSADAEREHNDQIRAQAKALGLKTVGVKMEVIEQRVMFAVEQEERLKTRALEAELRALEEELDAATLEAEALIGQEGLSEALRYAGERIENEGITDQRAQLRVMIAAVRNEVELRRDHGQGIENANSGQAAAGFTGAGDRIGRNPDDYQENQGSTSSESGTGGESSFLTESPSDGEINAAQAAQEAAQRDEEAKARAEQAAKDQAVLDAKVKARAADPDNFQFGENSKQAAAPIGDLFNQPSKQSEFSPIEKDLAAKAHDNEKDGDVGVVVGGGKVKFVTLNDAVLSARDAISAGTRATQFQIHNATGIRIGDVDRVLSQIGKVVAVESSSSQAGNVKPFSEIRQYLVSNVFGKEKGEGVPDARFSVGTLPADTIAEIGKFIEGFSDKFALVRISGRTLKHTDEQRHAELDAVIDSLPQIIEGQAEVLHNPTSENSAFIVYESDRNYLVVLEVAKNGNGTDVVNIITTRDRGLTQYRKKSAEWLDGRRSHHPVNPEVPAEGEISVFQPIGEDTVSQPAAESKQSAIASVKSSDMSAGEKLNTIAQINSGAIAPEDVQAVLGSATSTSTTATDMATTAMGESQAKIGDFGEKIDGARKDLWQSYRKAMSEELPADAKDITLAKHFPEPDYESLIANGVDIYAIATIKAMRDVVPAKPRQPYKVRRWGEELKQLRDMANRLITGEFNTHGVLRMMRDNSTLRDLADTAELYAELGYPAFKSAKGYEISGGWSNLDSDGNRLPGERYGLRVPQGRTEFYPDYQSALDALRAKLESAPEGDKTGKSVKLDLYKVVSTGDIVIGKKVASGKYIDLKGGFKTAREAREYLAGHEEDLLKLLEQKKEVRPERRSVNDPRVGQDYRLGEHSTPEKFAAEFGFRGVQFGNYVEGQRRQQDLNNAYDALLDLANAISVPPRAVSLNGSLGLAFGARGKGGKGAAAAHFEPDNIVINLTKREGAGSLGHEWFHALANYFARMRGEKDGDITLKPTAKYKPDVASGKLVQDDSVRTEVLDAFAGLVKSLRDSGFQSRSAKLDNARSKDYWSTAPEMSARAFEKYLIDRAAERGESNDYLANIVSEEAHAISSEMLGDDQEYPYPTAKEMEQIAPEFDKLFQTLQTKETDKGVALLSLSPRVDASFGVELGVANGVIHRVLASKKGWDVDLAAFDTFAALPSEVQENAKKYYGEAAASNAKGIAHGGKVYVIAANNESEADVEQTILHEVEGHVGIHRMYGGQINERLNGLFLAVGGRKGIAILARERGFIEDLREYAELLKDSPLSNEVRIRVMMDEVLAHYAQSPKFGDRVKAIVGMIRAWLRDHGFAKLAEYGETDLLNILSEGRRQLGKAGSGVDATVLMAGRAEYIRRTDQIERALGAMGLNVSRESSRQSVSQYLIVESPEYTKTEGEDGEVLKIRVSNHKLPDCYSQPDFEVIVGDGHDGSLFNDYGSWDEAVKFVADKFGMSYPKIIKRLETNAEKAAKKAKERANSYAIERLKAQITYAKDGVYTKSGTGNWWLNKDKAGMAQLGKFPAMGADQVKAAYIEKLQAQLQDKGVAVFNQQDFGALPESEWLSVGLLEEETNKLLVPFATEIPVLIRDTASDVGIKTNPDDGVISGAVYNGRIHLFRDGLADISAVQRTLWHELLHFGLRRFMTEDQYIAKMNSLYLKDGWVRGKATAWMQSAEAKKLAETKKQGYVRARAVDEALAGLAEIMQTEPTGYQNNTKLAQAKRMVSEWVAKLADFFGFKDAAQAWRSYAAQKDARDLIVSTFGKLRDGAPGQFSNSWSYSDPAFMVAWHGSPHDHNKFDSSKIGTGEGAQAYGWGHYFAGAREVAEWYRNNLSGAKIPDGYVRTYEALAKHRVWAELIA